VVYAAVLRVICGLAMSDSFFVDFIVGFKVALLGASLRQKDLKSLLPRCEEPKWRARIGPRQLVNCVTSKTRWMCALRSC
jgi:hypothetical protein